MFLHLSVSHSVHGGCIPGCIGADPSGQTPPCPVHAGIHTPPAQCMLGYTPPCSVHAGIHPPAQCMLGYTPPCSVHAGIHTPPAQCMLGYTPPPPAATAADGTHPTRMHICCDYVDNCMNHFLLHCNRNSLTNCKCESAHLVQYNPLPNDYFMRS